MRTSRNPGLLAVTVGVGLAVLFGLLGGTGVLTGQVGFGLAVICVTAAALVYIFYSRGSNVEKTGYGALLFIVALAFIVPLLTITQQQSQAYAAKQQYDQTLLRGATIYGQYCASCHGFLGQGLAGPKLNNNPAISKFTNDDITRIISGGIPADPSNPTNFSGGMPAWSTTYGGSLTPDDINYLVALIRSSDKNYIHTNNLPDLTNGFSLVAGTLTAQQKATATAQAANGNKPTDIVDLTSQTAVTIDAINSTTTSVGWAWQAVGQTTADIKIKVGTTVTWGNKSSGPHNVASGSNGTPDGKFSLPSVLLANSTDTSMYTFTTPGEYPFFCAIHPVMIGWIEVVP